MVVKNKIKLSSWGATSHFVGKVSKASFKALYGVSTSKTPYPLADRLLALTSVPTWTVGRWHGISVDTSRANRQAGGRPWDSLLCVPQ